MTIIEYVAVTLLLWIIWELTTVIVPYPTNAETGEPVRPPVSLYQCYVLRQWSDTDE